MASPDDIVSLSILIIDDDLHSRRTLRQFLEARGHRVFDGEGGEDGLGILQREPVDIVMTDLKMPGMDGLETLKKIRQTEPVVKVIMHTGYIEEEQISEALSIGAKGYIFKPFKPANLLEVIKKVAAGM